MLTGEHGRHGSRLPFAAVAASILIAAIPVVFGATQAHSSAAEFAFDVGIGAIGALVLVAVRRWPVPGALGLAALASVSGLVTPMSGMAVLEVARRERPVVACWVALAGTLAHAAYGLWRPLPGLSYGWWLVLDVVVHAALLGWGSLIGARQALLDSLHDRVRRAEEEQGRRVVEARALERTALAREMHDVLAHRLSLVATHAGALEYRQDASPLQVATAAGVIRDGVHRALDELREVISVLRDDDVSEHPRPGIAELVTLVAESRTAGSQIRLDNRVDDATSLPPASGRTAYRIVQEGLTNARKHAPGSPVQLLVDGAAGSGLRIEIRNRLAPGTSTAPGTGTGLVGLTERARLTGGRLDHEFTGTGEFRLRAWLPWPA